MGSSSDIVIVGGSVAGLRAAQAAVRRAPDLRVTMISDEAYPPYERPPLSKLGLNEPFGLDTLVYPAVAELEKTGVEFLLGYRAESLDVDGRTVRHAQGEIEYKALVIATGCEAIVPPVLAGLPDVFVLRTYNDAVAIREALGDASKSLVIVGASFIGGELASMAVKEGRDVTLIDLASKPLGRFGEAVFENYQALHRDAGVKLHFGKQVVEVTKIDGVRNIVLDDGTHVPAGIIVAGVGVRPSVGWLHGSGLRLDNGIVCDSSLQAADHVFAAGDAVRWPNRRLGAEVRIEHWTNAAEQGRVSGLNAANAVLGAPLEPCANVPYFWSDQHGVRIQFAGHRRGDEQVLQNRTEAGSLFFYRLGDIVTGVLAFERRAEFAKIRTKLRQELSWQSVSSMLGESVS